MRGFFKSKWFKIIICILVLLIVFLIIGAATLNRSSPLSGALGTVVKPFQTAAAYIGNGFDDISDYFRTKKSYQEEISKLNKEVADYQNQLVDYEKTKQKLKLYEDFLEIKEENEDYEVCSASVIGRDSSNQFSSLVLDKGSTAGISVNDPVIYGAGILVGVVTKVAPTYSVVSTILDPSINVSAYEVRTRETGFVTSETQLSKKGYCKMSGLDRDTSIAVGGIVCTSGVGGIYPKDLIIGTVKEVKDDSHDISSYAVIKPDIDFSELEDVLVITDFFGQGVTVNE